MIKEACLWEKLDDQRVHCYLCAHECRISEIEVRHMRRQTKPTGRSLYNGVWQRDCCQYRSYRKKTALSFSAGLTVLFHCHHRLQF